jgi:DNA-directed RNA polymerase specialized sigma24 family protein
MLMAPPDEREVTLTGDRPTLTGFAAEQAVALTRFAYLLCGDRSGAEDLVQEALLGLFRRFGDELPVRAPMSYARRAVLNAYLSRSRRRAAWEVVTDAVPERARGGDGGSGAASTGGGGLLGSGDAGDGALWSAVSSLADRQRTVLVMRYFLDLADPAIAAELGCRVGTVRSLAARAFAALRADPALVHALGRDRP